MCKGTHRLSAKHSATSADCLLVQCPAHLDQKRLSSLTEGIHLGKGAARPHHMDPLPHEVKTIGLGGVLPQVPALLTPHALSFRLLKASDFEGLQQITGQPLL